MAKYDEEWYRDYYGRFLKAWVMIGFVVINCVVYMCELAFGDQLTDKGALIAENVIQGKEYYRIVTAMFLHAGMQHLLSNMVALFFFGGIVENSIGHIRFFFLYLFSGVAGNLASIWYENHIGANWNSVGASGAIYGLVGAILVFTVFQRIYARKYNMPADPTLLYRMLFVVVYMVYSGFANAQTNNIAHIGGLTCGILCSILISLFKGRSIQMMEI